MNSYYIGNAVVLTALFTVEATKVATNPTTVKLRTKDPAGLEVIYTGVQLTNGGPGVYSIQITPAVAGVWVYRWEGFGAVIAADEKRFEIRASAFDTDF